MTDELSMGMERLLRKAEIERFRQRRLDGLYPYLWLDATFVKVRSGGVSFPWRS